jgi:poly(3-hydroxybutyrate) depolymerase
MVAKALDPEKVRHYRQALARIGQVPAPAPVFYLHGTADPGYRPPFTQEEVDLDETLPFFTLREMLDRNAAGAGPAATTLVAGSTGVTEVVLQEFTGAETYVHGTVLNGGHNWPSATTVGNPPVATQFNTTEAIIDFWRANAGLP